MAKMNEATKKRLGAVVGVGKTLFHWGFIPTVLYLGKKENPRGLPGNLIVELVIFLVC